MKMQQAMLRCVPRLIGHARTRRFTTLSHVTESTVDHLRRHGYAIQDDFIPKSDISGLRSEIKKLIDIGAAKPNMTHVVSAKGTKTYEKSSVLQAELHTLSDRHLANIPKLQALQTDGSLCALISVFWPRMTLRGQSVKVQRASDGVGCFPIHVDSSPSHDSRKVTGLIYPHEEWDDDDGGVLRVYNTPISSIDIPPKGGRLVLLSSCSMHHRVLPSVKERYAITVWLSGRVRETVSFPQAELASLEARVAYEMVCSGLRDAAVRLVLREEWVTSLRESHDGKQSEDVLKEFERNLQAIRRIVPGVICGRKGFSETERRDVEKVVACEERLRKGFEEIEVACDGVPFMWT